jgi:hypothetical protein
MPVSLRADFSASRRMRTINHHPLKKDPAEQIFKS